MSIEGITIHSGDFKNNGTKVVDKVTESFSTELNYEEANRDNEMDLGVSQQRINSMLKNLEDDFNMLSKQAETSEQHAAYSLSTDYYENKCDLK